MSSSRTLRRFIAFLTVLSLIAPLNPALAAWAIPAQGPTGGNPSGPITTGVAGQYKEGSLAVGKTSAPHAGALLEVSGDPATDPKGVLFPRMTSAQRNNITGAKLINGLTVYNTDTKTLERYDTTVTPGCSPTPNCHWGPVVASTGTDGPAFYAHFAVTTATLSSVPYKVGNPGAGAFATPKFETPAADFDETTGIFKPSVKGKYLLSASAWGSYGVAICKNTVTVPSNNTNCAQGYDGPSGVGGKVSVVMDANGSTDFFQMWIMPNGTTPLYGDSTNPGYTYFSGSRIGNPVDLTTTEYQNNVSGTASAGQVAYFNGISTVTGSSNLTFVGNKLGIGTAAPTQSLDVNGNVRLGGTTLYGNGSVSSYGALTIQGTKSGWGGINFRRTDGTNEGTLMVRGPVAGSDTNRYSGVFNQADGGWDWLFQNGSLAVGTVPATAITGGQGSSAVFPSGFIGMFWVQDCSAVPGGWTNLWQALGNDTSVLGRYPVIGWPGYLNVRGGSPISAYAGESRPTGDHTHPVSGSASVNVNTYLYGTYDGTGGTNGPLWRFGREAAGGTYAGSGSGSISGTAGATGYLGGTNAPYISLTYCWKN